MGNSHEIKGGVVKRRLHRPLGLLGGLEPDLLQLVARRAAVGGAFSVGRQLLFEEGRKGTGSSLAGNFNDGFDVDVVVAASVSRAIVVNRADGSVR